MRIEETDPEDVPRQAAGDDTCIFRDVGGAVIRQRRADRYLDATAMCKAGGKLWNNYWQNSGTKKFVETLGLTTGIPAVKLVQSEMGRYIGGTWVHPQVAYHLAQWISPTFAVAVSGWLDELATVLDVDPLGPVVVGATQATTAIAQVVEEVPRVAPGDDTYIFRDVAGAVIRQRRADRYLDATAMCKAGGKLWGNYWKNESTRAFMDKISLTIRIRTVKLVQSEMGRYSGGTWVHPQVAYHLAQWISPTFAVAVSGWLDELATTGRVEIADDHLLRDPVSLASPAAHAPPAAGGAAAGSSGATPAGTLAKKDAMGVSTDHLKLVVYDKELDLEKDRPGFMDHAHGLFMEKLHEDLRVHCEKADKDVAARVATLAAEDQAKSAEHARTMATLAAEDQAKSAEHARTMAMLQIQLQIQMAANNARHVSDRNHGRDAKRHRGDSRCRSPSANISHSVSRHN
jgi:hypothetical protein